jgi:hypothetical protein
MQPRAPLTYHVSVINLYVVRWFKKCKRVWRQVYIILLFAPWFRIGINILFTINLNPIYLHDYFVFCWCVMADLQGIYLFHKTNTALIIYFINDESTTCFVYTETSSGWQSVTQNDRNYNFLHWFNRYYLIEILTKFTSSKKVRNILNGWLLNRTWIRHNIIFIKPL